MSDNENKNDALEAEGRHITAVESAADYIENFDILETITNVGNDEVFTPRKTCNMILDALPDEVWHNSDYKWLNPATKNGIFEREIALRLDNGLKDIIPDTEKRRKHILQDMIFSIGQTRFTANVARRTLYYCSQANRKCDGIKAEDGHYVNGYAIGNGSWFSDEEGNIKTPNIGHTFVSDSGKPMPGNCKDEEKKKYKCKYCGINGASAYNDANQRETYAYEFIHFDGKDLLKHLQDRFFGGDRNMKFDIIIGNPPYQLSDGGAGASAMPIYQYFIQQAIALKPKYISMIVPSKWMFGGKGLDDFRAVMISDTRMQMMHDFMNEKECFPLNSIPGGVCYFLWNSEHIGPCDIFTHSDGAMKKSSRYLNEGDAGIFIRDNTLISLINKIKKIHSGSYVDSVVSASKPYGLEAETTLNPTKYGLPPFSKTEIDSGYKIFGLAEKGKRSYFFVDKNYPIPKLSTCAAKWKVFISEADGAAGQIGNPVPARIIGKPTLGEPFTICTETFLEIGPFESKSEAEHFCLYVRTKFFRALVGIQKQSQHTTQKAYRFVPLQDFSNNSDIDWSADIRQIDHQLFSKYSFSKGEIEFVERNIQEMK